MSKQATKKKVSSSKKTAPKTRPRAAKPASNDVSLDSHIRVVAGSRESRIPKRQAIKKAVPAAGIRVAALMEKTGCQLRTIAGLVRRGHFEVKP